MYQLGGKECSSIRTRLGSKGPFIHGFVHSSARRLCHDYDTQQGETAVDGCHCPDDMVVRMRRVLFIPRSRYVFFSAETGMLLRGENWCWVTFHEGLYGGSSDCNLGVTNSNKDTQGHPTTVFCKISVRRNKYCLEFSIAWGRLQISRWPFHSCTIFETYLINSQRFLKLNFSHFTPQVMLLFVEKGNLEFSDKKCDWDCDWSRCKMKMKTPQKLFTTKE